ncbi:MAG TPA: PKD domain-containing protein, partial [Bacteroidia bacterium]|nr:PKD domain-containing protein [Bacteroidia bacterium]
GLTPGQSTILLWTVSNGPCASTMDTVIIFRDEDPSIATAGTDQFVCLDSINLTGNAAAVGSGNWTRIAGAGNIQNPSDPASLVSGLGIGTNTFVWTITNGVCLSTSDTVSFVRDAFAPVALAGPDKMICGSSTTLTGNIPTLGQGMWTIISGSGVVTTPNSPNSTLTGVNTGTTVLTWSITNGTCPPNIDTMVVVRSPIPNPPVVTGNQAVCFGESVTLMGSSTASNPSYVWWDAPAGGNALSGGASYTTPPLSGPIVVYLEVTDGTTQCPSTRTQYNVNVNPLPVISLGNDSTFCDSDSICLDAGAGMTSYQWNNGATSRVLCTNMSGIYWVEVIDANGCFGTDTIQLNAIPAPSINLGPDLTLCNGNASTIGVPSVPGETYLWSTGDTTNTISVNANGTYAITVSNGIGCTDIDEVVVTALNIPVAGFTIDTANCPQISFTDNSTDAVNWSWSFGDGSSSTTSSPSYNYQGTGNGTYNVTLVVSGPCGSDTLTQAITIDCIVGISMPDHLSVTVYPNPNDGLFKVRFQGLEADAELHVYNELGQQVYAHSLEGCRGECEEVIDLQDVAAGIYITKIKVGDAVLSKRVLIR